MQAGRLPAEGPGPWWQQLWQQLQLWTGQQGQPLQLLVCSSRVSRCCTRGVCALQVCRAHWCAVCLHTVVGQRCLPHTVSVVHPDGQGVTSSCAWAGWGFWGCLGRKGACSGIVAAAGLTMAGSVVTLRLHFEECTCAETNACACLFVQALMPMLVYTAGVVFGTEQWSRRTGSILAIVVGGVLLASYGALVGLRGNHTRKLTS